MYERYRAIAVDRDPRGVVTVTLDNPPLNGISPAMHGELATVFADIGRDPLARVAVLTATGERGFSAGGDLEAMRANLSDQVRWATLMGEGRAIVLGALGCDVPIVARINGHAIGLGATLALCCDITVMSERARIGDTHVKVGLTAGDGGSLLWPVLVGLVHARRFLLTGELMTGAEAATIGLVTEAVPADQLDTRTQAWVDRFLATAGPALRTTKRCLNMPVRQQAEAYMDAHLGLETLTHLGPDHAEAVAALVEKRPPVFARS